MGRVANVAAAVLGVVHRFEDHRGMEHVGGRGDGVHRVKVVRQFVRQHKGDIVRLAHHVERQRQDGDGLVADGHAAAPRGSALVEDEELRGRVAVQEYKVLDVLAFGTKVDQEIALGTEGGKVVVGAFAVGDVPFVVVILLF